ncbi:MAG: DUF2721 domain-containing protein [Candidatus Melainabacteria bacterium]|jgi:hypothetical protein
MIISGIHDLAQLLQSSIAPVTLISGAGLLLLSMTNRYGRAIDRIRVIVKEVQNCSLTDKERLSEQVHILYKRARLLRGVIFSGVCCILFVSITILSLFFVGFLGWSIESLAIFSFALGVLCLIVSLILFIQEVTLSLNALKIEVKTIL